MSKEVSRTRILIVDDHALFRAGLTRLLNNEPDMEVVAACASTEEALAVLSNRAVDLVLLDHELGEWRRSALPSLLRECSCPAAVLVVTGGISEPEVARVLIEGVSGVFLKHNPPEQLIDAIRAVRRGDRWVDPRFPQPHAQTRLDLSPRERRVLRGIVEGLANKEIGERLHISESSVKATLQRLFKRMGVRTRSLLVRVTLERFRDQL